MKIQIDFVSNSSCASFTIPKEVLTSEQILAIKNHIEHSKNIIIVHRGPAKTIYNSPHDRWDIHENKKLIEGFTTMDNFDMLWFLESIGVKKEFIIYKRH